MTRFFVTEATFQHLVVKFEKRERGKKEDPLPLK